MRKKFTLLLLVLSVTSFLQAQTFNLKAGLAISDIKWKNSLLPADIFLKNDVGFAVTMGIDFLQKKFYWISSDIGYVRTGASGNIPEDPTDPFLSSQIVPYQAIFHFIKVNSIAHFKVNLTQNFYPYIGVGPELNFLANYEDYPGILKIFENHGDLNNFFYGLSGVAGLRYETNRIDIGFEFLYSYAFNKMLSIDAYSVKNEISMAYFNYSITVGYRL